MRPSIEGRLDALIHKLSDLSIEFIELRADMEPQEPVYVEFDEDEDVSKDPDSPARFTEG